MHAKWTRKWPDTRITVARKIEPETGQILETQLYAKHYEPENGKHSYTQNTMGQKWNHTCTQNIMGQKVVNHSYTQNFMGQKMARYNHIARKILSQKVARY